MISVLNQISLWNQGMFAEGFLKVAMKTAYVIYWKYV